MGYTRAGFEVVGVDNRPMPNFPYEFHQSDALGFLSKHGKEFDVIHASPPCQGYTIGRKIHNSGDRHPDLIGPIRNLLVRLNTLWVMENVVGSPLENPIMLCGLMFNLRVLRHRLFESSLTLVSPSHPTHPKGNLTNASSHYSTGSHGFVCVAGHNFMRTAGAKAMKIDWHMTRPEMAQSIPPAYTEHIGQQLLRALR